MKSFPNRRHFLKSAITTSACLGLSDLGFLSRLPPVSAAEAALSPGAVQFRPEIEPLVRLLEETPREQLLEEIGSRIKTGLNYQDLLAALLLAGIRNIQPRPVGFKFHAVLVVNSAHLASISSPDSDRWLPIFWALDYFKSAQAQDIREGDWTMSPVKTSDLPPPHQAKSAFIEAMDNWDIPAADAAITSLCRASGAQAIFEILARYGARDFRDIGHKAIYVANAWRTLHAIGWRHAEPVLRSLAYALLYHQGNNPAQRDDPADRPGRRNQEQLHAIKAGWQIGKESPESARDLVKTFRTGTTNEASDEVVRLLNAGVAPQTLWDAFFQYSGELLMSRPGILSLHAVTTTNALHYSWQTAGSDQVRQFLLLQNAAFLPLFRGAPESINILPIDQLQPHSNTLENTELLQNLFADIRTEPLSAAQKTLAYLTKNPEPTEFMDTARRYIFLKGTNSHDYKFSSAVLEDYWHLSPRFRAPFLASSVFNLRGTAHSDNNLVHRIRAALI
jgi:hypothetical protein